MYGASPPIQGVIEGSTISAMCVSVGPTQWFKTETFEPITSTKSLTIHNATKKDSGTYLCYGTDNKGSPFQSTATVYVGCKCIT